jgi:hypothetical protein
LYEAGLITTQSACKVKQQFVRFKHYATKNLNIALSNERKRMRDASEYQKEKGNGRKCRFCCVVDSFIVIVVIIVVVGTTHMSCRVAFRVYSHATSLQLETHQRG